MQYPQPVGDGDGNELTIAEIKAERIDIALQETIFTGVDLIERFGLVGLDGGDRLLQHGFRVSGGAKRQCQAPVRLWRRELRLR